MGCLEGKVAVITGAGNGIGRSHALYFAAEGARVVVNDLGCNRDGTGDSDAAAEVVAEITKAGGEAVANGDAVGSFEAADRIIQAAIDAFGQIDVLVNNAGILRDRTILKMEPEEWSSVIEVHLNGTFSCLKAAAARMKDQGAGGSIINTSSSSGLLGNFGQANYGAAKIGIHALSRIAGWELARAKIRVNAIAPVALTRMTHDLPGIQDVFKVEEMGPQHITPIVAWLASDASVKITGQTFGVDGDQLFTYKMMTSHGATKRGSHEPWTQEEITAQIDRIVSW